jgi:DoxX-like family
MKRNTLNIFYWVSTVLFAGFMAFTAVPSLMGDEESVNFMHDMLGYPLYFISFISIAKLLGAAALLIPGIPAKIKEWAYAGLFFDLAGAFYSIVAVQKKFDPGMFFIILPAVIGMLSYWFWNKKTKSL